MRLLLNGQHFYQQMMASSSEILYKKGCIKKGHIVGNQGFLQPDFSPTSSIMHISVSNR